jgi:hypothetical protein
MEEVFSDPNRLFKAAWLYKNSENIFNQLEKYYKNKIAEAYQSGKTSTLNGFSSNPVGGVRSSETKGNEDSSLRKSKIIDVDDLHND